MDRSGPCVQDGMLPVIVDTKCSKDKDELVDEILNSLVQGYSAYYGAIPSVKELNAWKSFVRNVLDELYGTGYPLIFEYPLLVDSRVDLIVVGSGEALIVEGKGWRTLSFVDEVRAIADGTSAVNPCYQLEGYIAKFKYLHSANVRFSGAVYAYNLSSLNGTFGCAILKKGELRKAVSRLLLNSDVYRYVNDIVNGKLELSKSLVEALRSALGVSKAQDLAQVAQTALQRLLGQGYALTEEQARVVVDVLNDLGAGRRVAYLVEGPSGSGKTLLALTLFLLALSKGYKVRLGYVNNRLVNTLRKTIMNAIPGQVGRAIASLIGYSALPRRDGLCDYKFKEELNLLVVDEAQRLPAHSVKSCFGRPAKVIVALYDDSQVLLGNEAGTQNNLLNAAQQSGRIVRLYTLPGSARVPQEYIDLVRELLWPSNSLSAQNPSTGGVEVVVFKDIKDMLCELMKRHEEGNKIALICAFTESEGDTKKKLCWDSIKNIRIGYPLQSGFSLYKSLNLKVKWLMDEREEYPLYWHQDFEDLARLYAKHNIGFDRMDPVCVCSSVYGAQGMEAEYVGVVWGRDLIWRGSWTVNPNPITDYVGGRYSLKSIASRDPSRALELLKNRYYIMLTRATKGVYLFFEDDETRDHVASMSGIPLVSENEGCELTCPCLDNCTCHSS